MAQLSAYLSFDGTCEEAMQFYQSVLGGTLECFRYGGSPMADHAKGQEQKIMHASLRLEDGFSLMGSDPLQTPAEKYSGFSLSLGCHSEDEARTLFDRLKAGGSVQMELQATFWSQAFGMLTDRFGVRWLVNGPDPS